MSWTNTQTSSRNNHASAVPTSNRNQSSYNVTSSERSSAKDCCYKYPYSIGLFTFACTLTFIIVMALSWQYVGPGEIALSKNRVTQNVDEKGRIYRMNIEENGRYAVGPDVMFELFDNRIHQYTGALDVVASNSRGFTLTIACFYRIVEDELGELFTKYNTEWNVPVTNQILETVKTKAPEFSIDDYVINLEQIREELAAVVTRDLRLIHIQTVDMQLLILNCDFTDEVDNQYLRSVVQEQNNERQLIQRQVDIIIQDTETERRGIVANTSLVTANGAAEATRVTQTAQAEAERITELANTIGFTLLFDHFNVTDSASRTKFLEWYALDTNIANIRLLKGVDSALVSV
jgi:regulator of protease activity HflC (stomatin/prohibitin superfamily)